MCRQCHRHRFFRNHTVPSIRSWPRVTAWCVGAVQTDPIPDVVSDGAIVARFEGDAGIAAAQVAGPRPLANVGISWRFVAGKFPTGADPEKTGVCEAYGGIR